MGKHAFDFHFLASRALSYFKHLFSGSFSTKQASSSFESVSHRIAVLISHDKNMWGLAVVQRFFSSLREQMGYQHTPELEVLSAQGSRDQLRRVMGAVKYNHEHGHPYVAVVTVGNWCSKEVRDLLDTWSDPLPQVFCPVSDPVALGLVDSLEHTGSEISGVTSIVPRFTKQVETLRALLPSMKTLLAVYDPFTSDPTMQRIIEQHRQDLADACRQHDIELRIAHFDDGKLSLKEMIRLAEGVDAVTTLPEPTAYARMDMLVEACNATRTLLCTAELSSLYQGAAIGFGEHGNAYGSYAAAIVYDMLVNHRPLRSIPVIKLTHEPHVRFNQQALESQGLILSERSRCLLTMTSIFKD